jgi:plasmid stabilization system protein ParE
VASRNRRNITGSGTPEKSHAAYPCEVAGGSSLAEPWDDSSSAEALGSLTAGTWRPGRTLRVAASVLAEAAYAVVAPRRPMGKRGPETERSPSGRRTSRRWSRRVVRRRAQRVGSLSAPVTSAGRSVGGAEVLKG